MTDLLAATTQRVRDMGLTFPNVIADTTDMPDEVWRELRRTGLGGSDAAAAANLSKWGSPYALWIDKHTGISSFEENDRMWIGKQMEPVIAKCYTRKTGTAVAQLPVMLQHPELPWMIADVDLFALGTDDKIEGGVESKNVTSRFDDTWGGDQAPIYYRIQVLHYLAVSGLPWFDLAPFIGGNDQRVIRIERTENDIANLISIEEKFWKLVQDGTPPPYDGSDATLSVLKDKWALVEPGSTIPCTPQLLDALRGFEDAKQRIKDARALKNLYESEIIETLGEHEAATLDGKNVVTRKEKKGYTVKEHFVNPTRITGIPKGTKA